MFRKVVELLVVYEYTKSVIKGGTNNGYNV